MRYGDTENFEPLEEQFLEARSALWWAKERLEAGLALHGHGAGVSKLKAHFDACQASYDCAEAALKARVATGADD